MSNVITVEVLENGMVVHAWEWNDIAKAHLIQNTVLLQKMTDICLMV